MNSKPILVCLLMVTMAFSGCIGGDEEPIPNLNENELSFLPTELFSFRRIRQTRVDRQPSAR